MNEFFNENQNNNENLDNNNPEATQQPTQVEQPEPIQPESNVNYDVNFSAPQYTSNQTYEYTEPQNTDFQGQQPFVQPPVNSFQPLYNPISYTPQTVVEERKPMSKGLKVFALIMAAVLLLTGSCVTGYYLGKNKGNLIDRNLEKPYIDLAQKPEKTDEMTAAQVYEKVSPSVVGIVIYNDEGAASQASGIVFSKDGYIVTNDHIYSEIPSAKFKIYTHDQKEYDAKYIAGDVISDLAVLKVEASEEFTPAVFADSDQIFHGENVVAIGRPSAALEPSSITNGIISAVERRVNTTSNYSARLIQTTCAINPGSSGGALINMYGQVVGVTSSKLVSTAYDNVGYAIPTTVMQRIVSELISDGKVVSRAKLGITYQMVDSLTAEINGQTAVGLLIASVAEDSGLYGKAEENDMITHINSIAITDDSIVLDIIEDSKAGDTISVTILTSSGQTKEIEVKLQANIGESSYTTEKAETLPEKIPDKDSEGGIFNFPEGD